ncbi:hypothetical protein [Nocardia nepalensis]|uniref:hypothetical protein n=1 Tax=Nocardia nepalensis TaxID=3375448 RepID=UPI003B66F162
MPTRRLGANILCTRHNGALSRLDTLAGFFFRVLYGYQLAQADPASPARLGASQIAVFDGSDLERWLLKVLLGGVAAHAFSHGGTTVTSIRTDANHANLIETLFRGADWPKGWGFHIGATRGAELKELAPISLQTASGPDGSAWKLTVTVGVVELQVCLGRPDKLGPDLVARPGGIVLDQRGGRGHRLTALAWPDSGHRFISLTRR